jgi:NADPH2:quinone reductase
MHAFRGHSYGPPGALAWEEIPDPPLAEGQVRVAVKAAAVNFPDVLFLAGTYQVKPALPVVPGFEVAGVVVESRAPSVPAGARVAALLDLGGGYATHAVAGEAAVHVLPDAIGFEDAAALTITYQTAHFALHRRARVQAGEIVLVHAGAGGVGSAAIQIAKAAGARVIAAAGGPEKVAACLALGADVALDYTREDLASAVKRHTRARGADIVFDPVGGDAFDKATRCIAFEGRIVLIGFTSGRVPEVKLNHVLVKNYSVIGLHWGLYGRFDPAAVKRVQAELYAMHAAGSVKPRLTTRPLSGAPAAMEAVASRGTTGKLVLVPEG